MCGICGSFDFSGRPIDRDRLARLNSAMVHRGPDGEGYYLSSAEGHGPSCGLAQRRLAIIDLETGRQPLTSEDGDIWTVVNGEFYNHLDLRRELEAKGHRFATRSDSEVIVHLYQEQGPSAVERLEGMFALALWDQPNRRLVLARDRMGQKPLFYTRLGDRLVFASELRALMTDPDLSPRLNAAALGRYLRWLYLPGRESMLQGVQRLEPGRVMVVDASGVSERAFWSLPQFSPTGPIDEAEAVNELDRLLSRAVARRLMSDVPLGAFLSGGVDSSLICALMARAGGRPKTFTVGFGGSSFDETGPARRAADHLGCDHTEIPVRPDPAADLEAIVTGLDEPMADSSAIPTFWLCRATRSQVTVALSGDGGDELAAGYRRYVGRRLAERYNRLPAPLRGLARKGLGLLPQPTGYSGKSRLKQAQMFVQLAGQARQRPDTSRIDFLTGAELAELVSPDTARLEGFGLDPIAELFSRCQAEDAVSRMQWVDCLSYLPDDILVKVDRMSMANSLEVRSPLMDHRVVEFLAGLPVELKLKGLTTKHLLKQVARRYLPDEIVDRSKQGFEAPLADWFNGPLAPALDRVVGQGRLEAAGVLAPGGVARLAAEHRAGRRDRSQVLWGLLVLEMWMERNGVSV